MLGTHTWQLTSLPASHSYEAIAGSGTDLWVAALVHAAGSSRTGTLVVYRRQGGSWHTAFHTPVRRCLPTALAAVPRSSAAWMAGNAGGGQEVLRAVWQ